MEKQIFWFVEVRGASSTAWVVSPVFFDTRREAREYQVVERQYWLFTRIAKFVREAA